MRAEFAGQDRVVLLGVNKALKESGRLVEELLTAESFDVVMLSITDEEVEGLRQYIRNPVEVEMDDVEIIYEFYMKKFGDTSIPPEAYVTAVRIADKKGLEVKGIDIPSGIYEDIFVGNVQLTDMILLSLRRRRLLKKKWDLSDPERFASQWDSYLNKGGYMKVEKERAKHMALEILSGKRQSTAVIVESERYRDLVINLKSALPGYTLLENGEGTRGA